MSKFANFNMLRVWGGGIYEKERFYDLCDQHGILVWQDFMFASAGYPATKLRDEIIREANYQIKRLRNRACLALWCGCNDVIYFAFSNHSFEEGEVQATFGQRTFDKQNVTQTTKTMPFKKNETVRFGQINKSDLCENTDYLYLDIVANGEQKSAQVYFPFGWKDLNLPKPSYEVGVMKIEEIDGVYRAQIFVKANTFVRLFHVIAKDNLNPVLSDNYFDMEKDDEKILYAYFTQKPQISDISFGDFTTEWE